MATSSPTPRDSALRQSTSQQQPGPSTAPPPEEQPRHVRPQSIAIVGFGNFGQFLARTFRAQGHRVIGQSRGDYTAIAESMGCEYVRSADELMDRDPDVIVFCTSIVSLQKVLAAFPVQRLAGKLVVDVLSVKLYPRSLLLEIMPATADILCTHPMFGPESGKDSWRGLPFVYEVVRIDTTSKERKTRCDDFIDIWALQGCKMVNMSCEQHDNCAASTQFITHTTGRMLAGVGVESTPINTLGFESLLGVVDNTTKDSFDLFYGLYRYNPLARVQLDKLQESLVTLREKLERTEEEEKNTQT